MKITLDLLPEERKKEIRKKALFRRAVREQIRLLLPLLLFLAVLLSINTSLKIQLTGLEKSYSMEGVQNEYQELKGYEKRFVEVNSAVNKASNFFTKHVYWSRVFRELAEVLPEGIQITNFESNDYKVTLTGKAKSRDDLLNMHEALKASSCFSQVEIPLSNLVSRENVVFQATLEVKLECLNQKI